MQALFTDAAGALKVGHVAAAAAVHKYSSYIAAVAAAMRVAAVAASVA